MRQETGDPARWADQARARAQRVQLHLVRVHGFREEGEASLDWAPDLTAAMRRESAERKPVLIVFGVSALSLPESGFT